MSTFSRIVCLLLAATTSVLAHTDTNLASPDAEFADHWGGFLISTAFRVAPEHPQVILTPASLHAGDRLLIRPQRVNTDEYLILQRCIDLDCRKAEVVRAWNALGYMGPCPVLTRAVVVKSGGPYMLWMQHVPIQGFGTFRQIDRDAPPLRFEPMGLGVAYNGDQLRQARTHGPEDIKNAGPENANFVVTFDSGSAVRLQALRVPPK